jgi:putative two-component system protein, hydrogenase maturation factor HypX/HoxX
MLAAVIRYQPDLGVAPMLKLAIPEAVWSQYKCLIVHPGIKGDRGPSSLDWAITLNEETWGVTIIEAAAEMDAGPVWGAREFSLASQSIKKSSLYRHQVTEAAVESVREAIGNSPVQTFRPEPLDYARRDICGCLRPPLRQPLRAIDCRTWREISYLEERGSATSTSSSTMAR